MEKRVLIAVFLSFLVLYAYQAIVPAPKPRPAPARPSTPAGRATTTTTTAAPGVVPPPSPSSPAGPSAAPGPVIEEQAERTITLETESVIARISNRGGMITSWRLKHYKTDAGHLVDLVPAGLPRSTPRPFAYRLEDPALSNRLNAGVYRITVDGNEPAGDVVINAPTTVTLEFADASGLAARKRLRFQPAGYLLHITSEVSHNGRSLNPVVQWGPGLGDSIHVVGEKSTFSSYVQAPQGIYLQNGSVQRLPEPTMRQSPDYGGTFKFVGIDDHYFIAALVNPPETRRVRYAPQTYALPGRPEQQQLLAWEVLFAQPPKEAPVFFGPKDFDVLAAVDRSFVKAIHFGMWDFLAVPLLRALKWINGSIGNYGWSIIVLTILINVAMFPLRHKSVVSMRKMQELQPQIKAIQDRYAKYKATDPEKQKMNQELMALYRERGVNPASGCLPMLLTMPVLFAFYSLLSVAIEMRGAPFALWITDLSVHDPYYITPVLMGATMLWQQKLTPVTDPAQQKVMMLTPIIFLAFFLWAPSGLVIYWTMSNLLGIGQQYATNRLVGAPVVRQVRPPAERRLKSAGAGRTEGAKKA